MRINIFIIILFVFFFYSNGTTQEKIKDTNLYYDTGYPIIEATGGIGLLWLFQGNVTISPVKYIYVQPRISSVIFANEAGFTIGLQKRFDRDSIIRIGMGYSEGSSVNLSPGGGSGENWRSSYYKIGLLLRKSYDRVYNPNINVISRDGQLFMSFNFTLGYCIYR